MSEEDPTPYSVRAQTPADSDGPDETSAMEVAVGKHVTQITQVARALEAVAGELHALAGPCRCCEALERDVSRLRAWLAAAIVDGLTPPEVEQVLRDDPAFASGEYARARREQCAADDYWAEVAAGEEDDSDDGASPWLHEVRR